MTRLALAAGPQARWPHADPEANPASDCASVTQEREALTAPGSSSAGSGPALDLGLRLSALDLRPLPGAVPSARLHARLVAAEWGLAAIAGDCELIVAELVGNAVLHGAAPPGTADTPPVRLRLTGRARSVQVEVWDPGEEMPQLRSGLPGGEEPGGRGLVLVAALSQRWGAYRARGGGKVTWAVISA